MQENHTQQRDARHQLDDKSHWCHCASKCDGKRTGCTILALLESCFWIMAPKCFKPNQMPKEWVTIVMARKQNQKSHSSRPPILWSTMRMNQICKCNVATTNQDIVINVHSDRLQASPRKTPQAPNNHIVHTAQRVRISRRSATQMQQ